MKINAWWCMLLIELVHNIILLSKSINPLQGKSITKATSPQATSPQATSPQATSPLEFKFDFVEV